MGWTRTNAKFPTFSMEPLPKERSFDCEEYDYEEYPDEIFKAPLSEHFSIRKMRILGGPDGFMLNGKLGVEFFPFSKGQI